MLGGVDRAVGAVRRRRRYRLDVLYAAVDRRIPTGHVVLAAVGIFSSGFSSIATGLNFIVTIHRLRAPGMTWYRHAAVPVVAVFDSVVLLVLATPVLAMAMVLIVFERLFHVGVFDPAIWAAIRCCSSICSGSTRIRPFTS